MQFRIRQLQGAIRRVETAGRNDAGDSVVSSGTPDIDQMLPARGYHRGSIIEWLADHGSGAGFLSLQTAKQATSEGGALVIIDRLGQFYPPAARALDIDLGNLIVLRGSSDSRDRFYNQGASSKPLAREDFYWAIDQSLRCSAVAAVWGQLPDFETPQIGERWLRRFQLSAESSGCLGLFLRPLAQKQLPSWSEIQWHVRPQRSVNDTRQIRTTLARCRGGTSGQSIDLEINTITGNVQPARREHAERTRRKKTHPLSLAAQLAHPATRRRSARA